MMSWNKTTEKKDKQRKDMEEITLIYLTEQPLHIDFDFCHLCYCLCFNPDDDIIISLYLFDYFVSICVPSSLCFPSLSLPLSLSIFLFHAAPVLFHSPLKLCQPTSATKH